MKKIFFIFSIFVFFSIAVFAQDDDEPNLENENTAVIIEDSDSLEESSAKDKKRICGSTFERPHGAKEFWHQVSPVVNINAVITINTEDKTKSAPSPVNFALSIGAIWPNNAFISFQPRLSFFTTYYLWNAADNYAYPAEVENRTALALSFMLDLPAAMTFRFEKCQVEAGLGLGVLARVALLAKGVSSSDSGTTGSAGSDKDEIQKWFWKDARFLYPEIFAAWEYKFSEKLKVGLEARWYIPLGSLIAGRGLLDASIIDVSAKFIF